MPDWGKTFKAGLDHARVWLANETNVAEDGRLPINRLPPLARRPARRS
jgi:hypothetical protein